MTSDKPTTITTTSMTKTGERNEKLRGKKHLYLAYGSNLATERMQKRCPDLHEVVSRLLIADRKLVYGLNPNGRGVATLKPELGATAAAVLYSVSLKGLRKLDKCEGVKSGVYVRRRVELGTGQAAYTYLLCSGDYTAKPNSEYWQIIASGLEEHGYTEQLVLHQQTKPPLDEKSFKVSAMPCANYLAHCQVTVARTKQEQLTKLLRMQETTDGLVFFFHGIFCDQATRLAYGVSAEAVAGELVNFERFGSPSNVRYRADHTTAGVLACVPSAGLADLDDVERTPAWYRRERVRIIEESGSVESSEAQFYIMNDHLTSQLQEQVTAATVEY